MSATQSVNAPSNNEAFRSDTRASPASRPHRFPPTSMSNIASVGRFHVSLKPGHPSDRNAAFPHARKCRSGRSALSMTCHRQSETGSALNTGIHSHERVNEHAPGSDVEDGQCPNDSFRSVGREQLHAQAELGGDGLPLCSGKPHVPRPTLRKLSFGHCPSSTSDPGACSLTLSCEWIPVLSADPVSLCR